MDSITKEFYNVAEAAKMHGLAEDEIWFQISEGLIPAYGFNKRKGCWVVIVPSEIKKSYYIGKKQITFSYYSDDEDEDSTNSETFLEDVSQPTLLINQIHVRPNELNYLANEPGNTFDHTPDFKSVTHNQISYQFTETQAKVIKFLFEQKE